MERVRSFGATSLRSVRRSVARSQESGRDYRRLPNGKSVWTLYDRSYRRMRRAFIAANPWCADCLKLGRSEPTTEVHHVLKARVRQDLRLDPENCVGLCESCHATRTARGE